METGRRRRAVVVWCRLLTVSAVWNGHYVMRPSLWVGTWIFFFFFLPVDMITIDSRTRAWATLGSFFDLQPRASQSSCHSAHTQCPKDNWCQWHLFQGYPSCLPQLIIKTLWDSTVNWPGLGLWLFDLTCCHSLSVSPLISPSLYVWVCLCVFVRDSFLTVKPTILEAELTSVDVQPYMSGKQHQLTCTAFGSPLPTVTWHWQPCDSDVTLKEWVTISLCRNLQNVWTDLGFRALFISWNPESDVVLNY